MVVFDLDHNIDFTGSRFNWLWYSHGDPPSDRPTVSGYQDRHQPRRRMAAHYFLTDYAHSILSNGYVLTPISCESWQLEIADRSQAIMFKLIFL
jgi:hypothetical protein